MKNENMTGTAEKNAAANSRDERPVLFSFLLTGVLVVFLCGRSIHAQEPSCLSDIRVENRDVQDEKSGPGPMKITSVTDEAPKPRKTRIEGSNGTGGVVLKLATGGSAGHLGNSLKSPRSVSLKQENGPSFHPVSTASGFLSSVGIPSHFAGFVTNYPHNDGSSYNYYNTANEKMPLWGAASGAPSPGVENAIWIGGDYDEYILDECDTGGGCYVPPPVDGVYRGWRAQGEGFAPCNCPNPLIQRCYFSANRGVNMFDLSYIPDKATINSVRFDGVVAKQFGSGERINISRIDADRSEGHENLSGTGFQFTYDDASMGHLYYTSWNVAGYAVGNPVSVTLNSTAVADVQASLGGNWFGLGLVSGAGETYNTAYLFGGLFGSTSDDPPYLVVDYTYVVPGTAVSSDTPSREVTGDGELTCAPSLACSIPDEAGGHPLHFKVMLSDTVPVHINEDFTVSSRIDFGLTDYYGMVRTASHDIYDETGTFVETVPPCVQLDPLELIYDGAAYSYAKNYNIGWRYGRPFVTHLATDTWEDEGYTPDGLGDAMMGFPYMEWASYNSISYPNSACATELGFPANVTAIGGYIPSGITESFEVAFEYDGDPGNYYSVGTISDVSGSFFATVEPPAESVTGVALFFTESSDGFAYLADLQVFDSFIYDTENPQTLISSVVASSQNPSHVIRHARLTAVDDMPDGTSISYLMSNNDGATWYSVPSGTDFVFPTDGCQLRWGAQLSTTSRSAMPRILGVTIDNLYGGAPVDSSLAPSSFVENATLGGVFQTIPPAGAPEFSGISYQCRYHPSGLPDGTWYWKTEAYAPAGTADSGGSSDVWSFTLDTDGTYPPQPVGDVLRASLNSETSVTLDWSLAAPQPGIHYHVRRSLDASVPGTLVAHPDATAYTDDSAVEPLIFYDIRTADDCERESSE